MTYCAKIVDNVVVDLIVVGDPGGAQWCIDYLGGLWIETQQDGSTHGKYASIGDLYDPITDTFSTPEVDPEDPVQELL